jgi:hypothetical protein
MVPSMTELDQAHERYEDFAVDAVRRGRNATTRHTTIRRALGLRVIALGRRLVGEPSLELARSR